MTGAVFRDNAWNLMIHLQNTLPAPKYVVSNLGNHLHIFTLFYLLCINVFKSRNMQTLPQKITFLTDNRYWCLLTLITLKKLEFKSISTRLGYSIKRLCKQIIITNFFIWFIGICIIREAYFSFSISEKFKSRFEMWQWQSRHEEQ